MKLLENFTEVPLIGRETGGGRLIPPPGWEHPVAAHSDPRWRPAPSPTDGSLVQDPDFSFPTTAGPLTFRLFHSSVNASQDSEFGSGRRASWPLRLQSDGTTVTVMHDEGLDRQYRNVSGSFVPQGPPTGDTLVQNGDGSWD